MCACPQDMHNDIQDVLGQNYGVPDDIDEDDLMGELDALEADMTFETEHESAGVPAYLQVCRRSLRQPVLHADAIERPCRHPAHQTHAVAGDGAAGSAAAAGNS